MIPTQSYTIWFSQRTGSTLLNRALSSTGVAGDPGEWLTFQDPAAMTRETLQSILRGELRTALDRCIPYVT
jgi:trehalose 2-sulfotransferase